MNQRSKAQSLPQEQSLPLISRERTEKLDLLHHLVANLARTVILCGPEGVGKTYLLRQFANVLPHTAIACIVRGDSQLNLETLQSRISETIGEKIPALKTMPLADLLERMPNRDVIAVLQIDDAGNLAPGMMEQIIEFASQYPALRLVFVLTHSEIYLKSTTDPVIEDCYHIEMPPLTELQCADFLEYLSTLVNPRIDFNAINEVMVAELYRETHGIPGKILVKLPEPANTKRKDLANLILACSVIGLIATALTVQWWSSRPKPVVNATTTIPSQPMASKQPQPTTASRPVQATATSPMAQPTGSPASTVADSATIAVNPGQIASNLSNQAISQPSVVSVPTGPLTTQPTQGSSGTAPPVNPTSLQSSYYESGRQWVMSQPAQNVTLQLMALYDEQAIMEIAAKYKDLGQSLRTLKTATKRGKPRFILLYGSYADPKQAQAEVKTLPKELQNTWLRPFPAVQAELNQVPPMPPATAPTPASIPNPSPSPTQSPISGQH